MKKEITYDRETRDYRMELDGRLIGYARTYHQAEVELDQVVFDMLTHGDFMTASELDAPIIDEPGVCETCHGEGRIPAYGTGDQAGGYAETCPDCNGKVEPDLAPVGQRAAFSAEQLDGPLADALTTAIVTTMVHDGLPSPVLRHSGLPNPLYRVQMAELPTCRNCAAPHHTWQCPEIGNLLFAEPLAMVVDVDYAPVGWA